MWHRSSSVAARIAEQVRKSIDEKIEKLKRAAKDAESNIVHLIGQYKHRTSVRALQAEPFRPKEYD